MVEQSYIQDTIRDHKDILRFTSEIYSIGKANNSNEDILYALLEQSRIYFTDSHYSILLKKLEEGIDLSREDGNYNMLCRFLIIYQKYLWQFDHLKECNEILERCECLNQLVKNEDDRRINGVFILLAQADIKLDNTGLNRNMNSIVALKKRAYMEALKISQQTPLKIYTLIFTLESLSWSCALSSKIADARFYINKAQQLICKNPNNYLFTELYKVKGTIENIDKNYTLAIRYFQLAIEKSIKNQNLYKLYEIYPMISASYGELHKYNIANEYFWKYKNLADSINNIKRKSNNIALIIKINNKIFKKGVFSDMYLIAILPLLLVISLFFINKIKLKKAFVQEIGEKSIEPIIADKVNAIPNESEMIERLITLAKENIAAFYIEFRRCYPQFSDFLMEEYSELNVQDVNFCSLMKMNFSIKEIAVYTKTSIRSAESRRYRIRKKMKLESQDELYLILSKIS